MTRRTEPYAVVVRGSNGTEPCYMETEPKVFTSQLVARIVAAWSILTAHDYRAQVMIEVSVVPADEATTRPARDVTAVEIIGYDPFAADFNNWLTTTPRPTNNPEEPF